MVTKIGLWGSYKVDIIHYMTRIFNALQKSVAVVEANDQQIIKYTIPDIEEKTITYRGIDFHLNYAASLEQLHLDSYDIVIIDFAYNTLLIEDFLNCHIKLMITDFNRYNVMKLQESLNAFVGYKKPEIIKVYRDLVASKINKKYIDGFLMLENYTNVIASYQFQLCDYDYRCNIESQYNDVFSFKKLSKDYKEMFYDIISETIKNIDNKTIKKAIWVGEGGK